jgi:hypothetical protein
MLPAPSVGGRCLKVIPRTFSGRVPPFVGPPIRAEMTGGAECAARAPSRRSDCQQRHACDLMRGIRAAGPGRSAWPELQTRSEKIECYVGHA